MRNKILGLVVTAFIASVSIGMAGMIYKEKREMVGGRTSTQAQSIGAAVSSTVFTYSTSTLQELSANRSTRNFGYFVNYSTGTAYIYLGPTSTATIAKSIPVLTNTSFPGAGVDGIFSVYTGPVVLMTSTNNGTVLWLEKAY